MKNFLQIFLFITFSILTYYFLSISFDELPKEDSSEKIDALLTAEINFVGDLMCHSTQFQYAHVKDDSFDFNGTFSEVKKYLSDADFTIGNFETVLAGKKKRYDGYPYFNAPDDFLLAIKERLLYLIYKSLSEFGFLVLSPSVYPYSKGFSSFFRGLLLLFFAQLRYQFLC